jgi:hypothetical protein
MIAPIRSIVFLACLSPVWWLAGCASQADPSAGERSFPSAGPTNSALSIPKLEKGMAAEDIRQKLGVPVEIQPMKSSAGKAEVWVYRFERSLGMTQVATGTRDIPVMSVTAAGAVTTTMKEPVYSLVEKKAVVTLSLLMLDGQLAAQKARVENTLSHF